MANISKRGNTYRIRVSCGYDITGKQIIKSMTWTPEETLTARQLEKELHRQAVLFEDKCMNGLYLDGSIKFADFAERWLTEYAEKQLKVKTVIRYREILKRINRAIGHISLNKIQPLHLMQFYDNLAEEGVRGDVKYKAIIDIGAKIQALNLTKTAVAAKCGIGRATLSNVITGHNISEDTALKLASALDISFPDSFTPNGPGTLSDSTVRYYHRVISSILQTAVEWQIILSNPCSRVKPPKVTVKESRYMDDLQVIELFEALDDEPLKYKTMITLLVYSGMRRGELMGLKWSDIDSAKKLITIRREILYTPSIGLYEDTTKNVTSQRIIKVADQVFVLLAQLKAAQAEDRLKCGNLWIDGNYVFTQWNGSPMHPDSATGWFNKFLTRHNLAGVCLHSLRHTNASLLIANGVNLTTVSKRLGHASTDTTAKIYAHAIKTADELASDTLQDLLSIKTQNNAIMTK